MVEPVGISWGKIVYDVHTISNHVRDTFVILPLVSVVGKVYHAVAFGRLYCCFEEGAARIESGGSACHRSGVRRDDRNSDIVQLRCDADQGVVVRVILGRAVGVQRTDSVVSIALSAPSPVDMELVVAVVSVQNKGMASRLCTRAGVYYWSVVPYLVLH